MNAIIAIFIREFKITYKNFTDILSIFLFFLLGIIIFVFSLGDNREIYNQISIGIIWTLILLSNNLSLKRFYQDDFNDGNIVLFHMSGISYEVIVVIKLLSVIVFFQIPFLVMIPVASLLLNIQIDKIQLLLLSFLIGSPILTSIASIAGSMSLLNNKNFAIGSLIIMFLSIPLIIFSVGIVNGSEELVKAQLNILLGILFIFLAITPWVCAACIKLALKSK